MIVILKNIPTKATKQNIKDFVLDAVKGGWFDKKGKVLNISLLIQRNLRTHVISHHGLVIIEPDSVAERVIKKTNRKILLGKHIAVAEYKKRDFRNDPRQRYNSSKVIVEQRICDRREQYEILDDEDLNVTARRNFHRMG